MNIDEPGKTSSFLAKAFLYNKSSFFLTYPSNRAFFPTYLRVRNDSTVTNKSYCVGVQKPSSFE